MINAIGPVPSPLDSQAVFNTKAFNLLAQLPGFVGETNQTAQTMQINADVAAALILAMALPQFAGTSTSSVTVGTGARTFLTQAGKGWLPGQIVVVSSGANYVKGTVMAYSGTDLELNVTSINGSGTYAAWTIGLSYDGLALAGSGDNINILRLLGLVEVPAVVKSAIGSISGSCKKLQVAAPGLNSYTQIITAEEVVLKNSSNVYYTARSVNLTVNANGTVGAPLAIMSARAASTWYYRWLWYNPTTGLTATLDASSTAPTPPTGYTSADYKCLLPGASRTDGSGSTYLRQVATKGKKSWYAIAAGTNDAVLPQMAGGAAGSTVTPTFVPIAVASYVPPTAASIALVVGTTSAGNVAIVGPNAAYGASAGTNPPPVSGGFNTSTTTTGNGTFQLEGANIYWASTGAGYVNCMGWEDEQ